MSEQEKKVTKSSQARIKASMNYNKKHEEIYFHVTKEQKIRFVEKAKERGFESLKAFVVDCIEKD